MPFTICSSVHCSELTLVSTPLFAHGELRQSICICWTRRRFLPHLKQSICFSIWNTKSWRASAQWVRIIKPCSVWCSRCSNAYSSCLPHTRIHPVNISAVGKKWDPVLSRNKESSAKADKKAQQGSKDLHHPFFAWLQKGSWWTYGLILWLEQKAS